jgi:hypothetical protein
MLARVRHAACPRREPGTDTHQSSCTDTRQFHSTDLRQSTPPRALKVRQAGHSPGPAEAEITSAMHNIGYRRLWACRIAAPSEHDDARVRKANEAIQLREFVPRDPCRVSNHGWCMPRWLSLECPLLAEGAAEYERHELSRRAESAPRAGRPIGDAHGCVRSG